MYRQQIDSFFEQHREQFLTDLRKLISIPSVRGEASPAYPYGEEPARALAEALEISAAMGFKTENWDNYVGIVEINDFERQLDMLVHLDVVPADNGWSVTEPFKPHIVDGKIYGRGSADDKGPAIAALYALQAVKDIGVPLTKNVRLVFGTDEENGSSDLEHYYSRTEEAPMTFSPDAEFPVINVEKGSFRSTISATFDPIASLPKIVEAHGGIRFNVVPDFASAKVAGLSCEDILSIADSVQKNTGIAYTSKSDSEGLVTIEARGKSAHAAGPANGNNAITGLLALLSKLPIADGDGINKLRGLYRVFPHGDCLGKTAGIAMSDEISGELTISLNILDYTETSLAARFDSRIPICANDQNLKFVLSDVLKKQGLELQDVKLGLPHHVPIDTPFVQALLKCYEMYSGQKGYGIAIGGGTYTHGLENGVAFGCSMPGVDNHMHGPDEFSIIDDLIMSSKIFAQAIIELCK